MEDNDIEMYSIHNEGKSVAGERFIRTLKTKIYKHMTSMSKNVYIDKLDDIFGEYNNTYHRTFKIKPVDVNNNTYIDFKKEVNDKDPKLKVGDRVRISKYKNIFAKGYKPSCNHVHNILELYNVLIQTRLTTSKTKRDVYYCKLGIRVASRVGNKKTLGKC